MWEAPQVPIPEAARRAAATRLRQLKEGRTFVRLTCVG